MWFKNVQKLYEAFSGEDTQAVSKYIKTYSTMLIMKEMQTKATKISYLTPIRRHTHTNTRTLTASVGNV